MKALILALIVSSPAWALKPVKKEEKKTTVVKETKSKAVPGAKAQAILEDCDDKAKKAEEKKIESLSLGGGDTGCTIE